MLPGDIQVEGFRLMRIISDRERSKVYLARATSGRLVRAQGPAAGRACGARRD